MYTVQVGLDCNLSVKLVEYQIVSFISEVTLLIHVIQQDNYLLLLATFLLITLPHKETLLVPYW